MLLALGFHANTGPGFRTEQQREVNGEERAPSRPRVPPIDLLALTSCRLQAGAPRRRRPWCEARPLHTGPHVLCVETPCTLR